jgi:hypothetical protein
MIQKTSRRGFLAGFGAIAAAGVMPRAEAHATTKDLQFGCAAITWVTGFGKPSMTSPPWDFAASSFAPTSSISSSPRNCVICCKRAI